MSGSSKNQTFNKATGDTSRSEKNKLTTWHMNLIKQPHL